MAIDLDTLDGQVLTDIIRHLGHEDGQDEEPYFAQVRRMSFMEAWDHYLKWNGFIGFAGQLHIAHESISGATT
jgi:hypothetical protein